ncbi:unnamed protein product, partial [Protopolystoma xenopodis]
SSLNAYPSPQPFTPPSTSPSSTLLPVQFVLQPHPIPLSSHLFASCPSTSLLMPSSLHLVGPRAFRRQDTALTGGRFGRSATADGCIVTSNTSSIISNDVPSAECDISAVGQQSYSRNRRLLSNSHRLRDLARQPKSTQLALISGELNDAVTASIPVTSPLPPAANYATSGDDISQSLSVVSRLSRPQSRSLTRALIWRLRQSMLLAGSSQNSSSAPRPSLSEPRAGRREEGASCPLNACVTTAHVLPLVAASTDFLPSSTHQIAWLHDPHFQDSRQVSFPVESDDSNPLVSTSWLSSVSGRLATSPSAARPLGLRYVDAGNTVADSDICGRPLLQNQPQPHLVRGTGKLACDRCLPLSRTWSRARPWFRSRSPSSSGSEPRSPTGDSSRRTTGASRKRRCPLHDCFGWALAMPASSRFCLSTSVSGLRCCLSSLSSWPRRRLAANENLFVLSVIQLLCGFAAVILSGVAVRKAVFLHQMATGLWAGVLMLTAGLHGLATARRPRACSLVSLLVISVLVSLAAGLLACVSIAGLIEDGLLTGSAGSWGGLGFSEASRHRMAAANEAAAGQGNSVYQVVTGVNTAGDSQNRNSASNVHRRSQRAGQPTRHTADYPYSAPAFVSSLSQPSSFFSPNSESSVWPSQGHLREFPPSVGITVSSLTGGEEKSSRGRDYDESAGASLPAEPTELASALVIRWPDRLASAYGAHFGPDHLASLDTNGPAQV